MGNVAARAPSTSRNTLHGPAHRRTASPIHGLRTIHKPRIRQATRPKPRIRSTSYSFSSTFIKPHIHQTVYSFSRTYIKPESKVTRRQEEPLPTASQHPSQRLNRQAGKTQTRKSLTTSDPARHSFPSTALERIHRRTNPRCQETRTDTPPTLTGRWSTRQCPEFSCPAAAASICERA